MAHLLVTNETIVTDQPHQENIGKGKHKRTGHDEVELTCNESSMWPGSDTTTKRRALAPITNQVMTIPNRQHGAIGDCSKKKPPTTSLKVDLSYCSSLLSATQSSLDALLDNSSSYLTCEEEVKAIGSEMSFTRNQSRLSMALSSSFRSLESSVCFDSPMNVSSPDLLSSSKLYKKEFVDIDQIEDCNCCITGEYAGQIFAYLREAEVRFQPNPQYMKKQPDITQGMRCILVDWLVEVAEEFKLDQHTLYMAISIVDRFLSCMSVMRSKLQLVGGTAMYIASKFEEIFPPEISDFTYITDDTYTKIQIVRMERLILKELDFNLSAPNTHTFLLRYLKASDADLLPLLALTSATSSSSATSDLHTISKTITFLSMYLCELALQDADPYLKYYPSVIAASAVCLARHTLEQTAWPKILEHYSGYTVFDIGSCVQDLHRTLALAPHHAQQAIRQKYSSQIYHMISSIRAPETLPC